MKHKIEISTKLSCVILVGVSVARCFSWDKVSDLRPTFLLSYPDLGPAVQK